MLKKILKFIFLILLLNCAKEIKQETQKIENKPLLPDIIQYNYRHYIYKNGKKYLFAVIEKAMFFEKKQTIEFENIYAQIYNGKGELTCEITANKGIIEKEKKKVTFSENVVFNLIENKIKLNTNSITLDYLNNKLKTDGEVLIAKEDGSFIKSDSMESDIKNSITKFEKMLIKYYYEENEEKKD